MKGSVPLRVLGIFREFLPFLLAAMGLLACASIQANTIQVVHPKLTGIIGVRQGMHGMPGIGCYRTRGQAGPPTGLVTDGMRTAVTARELEALYIR